MRTVGRDYVPSMSMRASAVRHEIKRMLDLYVGRTETQLIQWQTTIDELTIVSEPGDSDVQIQLRSSVGDLKAKFRAAQARLAEFKIAGAATWGTCKLCVEQAWDNLEGALASFKGDIAAASHPGH